MWSPDETLQAPHASPPDDQPIAHSGFVGLVGKPNVGKSTILNYFLGRKVSIVSPRPQTTRQRILGILTRPDAQIIFVDSPGWHKPDDPLGRYLIAVAKGVVQEADVLIPIIDARSGIGREDEWVFDQVRESRRPAVLAINKVDLVKKPTLLPLMERLAGLTIFEEQVPISALTGENMDALLDTVVRRLPAGPRWYEAAQITDQSTEQIIREFIREQVFRATHQEVPQAVAVMLDGVEEKDRVVVIRATILVDRTGQKAIVIGKGGQMLKHIGQAARLDLERWLGRKVFLELWVKIHKDWRSDASILRELGYDAHQQ